MFCCAGSVRLRFHSFLEDVPIHYTVVETEWVVVGFLSASGTVTRLIWSDNRRELLCKLISGITPTPREGQELLGSLQRDIVDYFRGRPVGFDCELDISWASEFGQRVLQACSRIPLGEMVSYGELARQVDSPGAARAVGSVMAANQIPLLIPCHRVVAANGSIGDYSGFGGSVMKKRLLTHEKGMSSESTAR